MLYSIDNQHINISENATLFGIVHFCAYIYSMEIEIDDSDQLIEAGSTANPFIGTFKINVVRTHVYDRDGQVLPHYDYETDNRATVYHDDQLSYKLCVEAKPVTVKLYLYMIYKSLAPDRDYIIIDPNKICTRLDISRRSLYVAIAELQDYRVMTKKRGRQQYWINPRYIFRGKRSVYMEIIAPLDINIIKHNEQFH